MGYEVKRFIKKVDEEFHCSVCKMILKNPIQSKCEHVFCSECIEEWIMDDGSCPVDLEPLQLGDLQPISRTVRNLMNKLEIKCDFEPEGCEVIVKLGHLEDHVGRCLYNPNKQVIPDKSCCRRLEDRAELHQEQITNLNHQVSLQNEKYEKLNDEVIYLRSQQENFINFMSRQNIPTVNDDMGHRDRDGTTHLNADMKQKLDDEISQLYSKLEQAQNIIIVKQDRIKKLKNEIKILKEPKNEKDLKKNRHIRSLIHPEEKFLSHVFLWLIILFLSWLILH